MNSFHLQLLSAERNYYQGECESLIVPLSDGQYGIYAHHSALIANLVPGQLTFRVPGGKDEVLFVSEGLLKAADNRVLVLVDSIERPEEIDVNRAKCAEETAREELLQTRSRQDYLNAQAHLLRAKSRLKAAGKADPNGEKTPR